jgi:hypothetical protein
MSKRFATLSAAFAILAAAGCGEPQSPDKTVPETPREPSNLTAGVASAESFEAPELASNAVSRNVGTAPANALAADPRKEGARLDHFDARNSEFTIDGATIYLKNGLAVAPATTGSASLVTIHYLGKEVSGDLNGDGRDDVAYFVTRDGSGSGLFIYVVAALNGTSGYKTTNAFFVGDRIQPQSLRISGNEVYVNFAGHGKGEPMTTPPTQESVLLLKVTPQGVLRGLMK